MGMDQIKMILSLVTLSICANASDGAQWPCKKCTYIYDHKSVGECEMCQEPNPFPELIINAACRERAIAARRERVNTQPSSDDTEVQSLSDDSEAQSQHEAPREEVTLFGKIYKFFAGESEDAVAQSPSEDDEVQSQSSDDSELEIQLRVAEIESKHMYEQKQRDAENQRRHQEQQELAKVEKARLAKLAEAETAA